MTVVQPGEREIVITREERDGRTLMTSTSTFESPEDRDGMVRSGMESGARESYERLDAVLKTL